MKVLMQRVKHAKLISDGFTSEIGFGVLAFVGVSKNDTIFDVNYLANKIAHLRMFDDENDKTNLSLLDVNADIMIVSNFTLQADTKKGFRPDFFGAGNKDMAIDFYEKLIAKVKEYGLKVEHGNFGHEMNITTDLFGPFTLMLESEGRNRE